MDKQTISSCTLIQTFKIEKKIMGKNGAQEFSNTFLMKYRAYDYIRLVSSFTELR